MTGKNQSATLMLVSDGRRPEPESGLRDELDKSILVKKGNATISSHVCQMSTSVCDSEASFEGWLHHSAMIGPISRAVSLPAPYPRIWSVNPTHQLTMLSRGASKRSPQVRLRLCSQATAVTAVTSRRRQSGEKQIFAVEEECSPSINTQLGLLHPEWQHLNTPPASPWRKLISTTCICLYRLVPSSV